MKNLLCSFCDFLWVLQAFLRGKILRQRAYRPQAVKGSSQKFFNPPEPVTAKRIVTLLKWWGHRPMTSDEVAGPLMNLLAKRDDPPFLYFGTYCRDGAQWTERGGPGYQFFTA